MQQMLHGTEVQRLVKTAVKAKGGYFEESQI
jgi:hypothetical protein